MSHRRLRLLAILAAALAVLAPPSYAQSISGGASVQTVPLQVRGNSKNPHVGAAYSYPLQVIGGVAPYSCALTSGSLPTGLSLSGCTISGTATSSTQETFTITVTDNRSQYTVMTTTLNPATLSSVSVSPTSATVAVGSTQQISATANWSDSTTTDVTTLATWSSSATATATVSSSGLVQGVAAGSANVTATYNTVASGNAAITVPATGSSLIVSTTSLPNAQINQSYPQQQLACSGGTPPCTWTISSGSLPTGLSLSTDGVISGAATGSTATFTVEATDAASATATKSLTITVATVTGISSVTCSPSTLSVGGNGQCAATASYSDGTTGDVTSLGSSSGSGSITAGATAAATSNGSNVSSLTDDISVSSGQFVFCGVRSHTDAATITISDSAGQTGWAATSSGVIALTNVHIEGFYIDGSAALTWVKASASGASYPMSMVCKAFNGVAASSAEDASVNASSESSVASITSGSLTTTNPSDLLIAYGATYITETSWTAGSGFTIPSGGVDYQDKRDALSYRIVSAVQSGVTTIFTLSPGGNYGTGLVFAAFKAAATGGGTGWSVSSCTNSSSVTVASVDGNGVVTALQPGTCDITATLDSYSASATVTVQSSSTGLTSLSITPSSASVVVGSTQSFTATGSDGSNYTGSSSWASSDPSSVSMSANQATCLAVTTSPVTVTASVGGTVGTASISCVASVSSGDLLHGCTVNSSNVPSCSTPSGWTLQMAQGFESGTVPSTETIGDPSNSSITTTNPHTGTHSEQCSIAWDGATCELNWLPGATTYSDIYVSFWRYMDTAARGDLEIYFARLYGTGQDVTMDTQNYQDSYGVTHMTAQFFAGSNAGGVNWADPNGTGTWNLPLGQWEQVEVWIHPNTCGNSDGFYRLYINGQQVAGNSNVNMNGCQQMSGSSSFKLTAGGVFTYMVWENSSSQCIDRVNHSGGTQVSCNPGSTCPTYEADGTTPCVNYGPFKTYLDDVIVLTR